MKNLKIEDFYKLSFLSDLAFSGNTLFFVKTNANKNKNDYESKIYVFDGKVKEFTSGPRDSSPKPSPNGKYLAFIGKRREKKTQLMLMPLDGGEAKVILEMDDISHLKWSNDSKKIYFISNVKQEEKDDVKIIDSYPFYFNNKGFIYNKRPTLFVTDLKGRFKKLTDKPYNVQSFDVSINNDIALTMSLDGQDVYWNNLYFMKNGKLEKFPLEGSFSEPEFSEDGKSLAIVYSDNKRSVFQHHKLYILDLEKNMLNPITDDLDRDIGNSINSDSRMGTGKSIHFYKNCLYYAFTDHGHSSLFCYDFEKNEKTNILNEKMSIDFYYPSEKGIFIIAQKINYPQELYLLNKNLNMLTRFNKYFDGLPEPVNFTFNATDGETVEGWFLSRSNEKLPTILEIHGGPKTAYGYSFMFDMQFLASSGFNILFMNPRGSDGYSENFALKIKEHYGERDYLDIIEGVNYAISHFSIDKSNIGVTGGSYGGFMTNWIVGHTDMFKAALSERSISNQISFFGTSDIGPGFNSDQIGNTPFKNLEHYWEKSPLKYSENVKTPILILHSDEDYRCPVEQAYQFYSALKYFNKETKLVIFPGENHELSRSGKPKHRTRRIEIIYDWFKEKLSNNKK